MDKDLILGIDVGSTSVKAGLIGIDGTVAATYSDSYPTARGEGGRAEQSPEDWTRRIDAAIDRFVSEGFAVRIAVIGLCSQVNTHVFAGDDGTPLCPAVMWQDRRSAGHAAKLESRVSEDQKIRWWGAPMPIDSSHVLSRMAWMADVRPSVWQATRWVLLPKDYCLLHLTGIVSTDPISNIGLVGPDLRVVAGVFDLAEGSRSRIAPLVGVTAPVGRMRKGHPLAGVPVVSGTMDGWAGIVGAGGAREGSQVYLSGTSEILGITSQRVVPTPGTVVFPEVEGLRIHAAPTQSGGDATLWFAGTAGLSLEQMASLVAETPRGADIPLFLPQLEGERAPYWNSALRGAFLSLSRRTGPGQMARAVYEGVALSARDALEALEASAQVRTEHIACAGGGFQSAAWAQIRADVLGKSCHMLASGEPGVLGAAMIASVGAGHFNDLQDAQAAMVSYNRVFEPDPAASEWYDRLFEIYRSAITTVHTVTQGLNDAAKTHRKISDTCN